jgi:hypothetical protein
MIGGHGVSGISLVLVLVLVMLMLMLLLLLLDRLHRIDMSDTGMHIHVLIAVVGGMDMMGVQSGMVEHLEVFSLTTGGVDV